MLPTGIPRSGVGVTVRVGFGGSLPNYCQRALMR